MDPPVPGARLRRDDPGPGQGAGGDEGGYHGDRQPAGPRPVPFPAGLFDGRGDRERIHGGDRGPLSVGPGRNRPRPLPPDDRRQPGGEVDPHAHGSGEGREMTSIAFRRHDTDRIMKALFLLSAFLVILPLFLIFFDLLWKGAKGLKWSLLTDLPRPVGETGGGVANGIVGNRTVTGLAVAGGSPPPVLAGRD